MTRLVRVFLHSQLRACEKGVSSKVSQQEPPRNCMIHYDSKKFKQHGTILNRNKVASGRPRSIRTLKIVSAIKRILQDSP